MPNVKFLNGQIEHIPLEDASVDVVISNCVINLSSDKSQVLREGAHVLKPGGRFAASDVVVLCSLPVAVRASMDAWAACLGGALGGDRVPQFLGEAGFSDIEVEVTRVYGSASACCDESSPQDVMQASAFKALEAVVGGRFVSALVRARKPGARSF